MWGERGGTGMGSAKPPPDCRGTAEQEVTAGLGWPEVALSLLPPGREFCCRGGDAEIPAHPSGKVGRWGCAGCWVPSLCNSSIIPILFISSSFLFPPAPLPTLPLSAPLLDHTSPRSADLSDPAALSKASKRPPGLQTTKSNSNLQLICKHDVRGGRGCAGTQSK